MLSKIDWLSASAFRVVGEGDSSLMQFIQAYQAFEDLAPELEEVFGAMGDWKMGKGRKPYAHSWLSPHGGALIFTSPRADHVLLEIQGRGCDRLATFACAGNFLHGIAGRLTRIDVAVDMECDASPLDFVAARNPKRFKSHSEFVSQSGTTAYVGSRTSERYARVYRYNPPHPRAHLLRSEFVVKHEDARLVASGILSEGVHSVATTLGKQFGWAHAAWDPKSEGVNLRTWRPERRKGKTEFWLCDTIAPLLIRMNNEDDFDVEEWYLTNVLPGLK